MPKVSEEVLLARREEIIDACAKLYETMNFKDITLKEIGKVTTFNRTAIYNYFNTKEEIFLALMQREYDLWVADLEQLLSAHESLSHDLETETLVRYMEWQDVGQVWATGCGARSLVEKSSFAEMAYKIGANL